MAYVFVVVQQCSINMLCKSPRKFPNARGLLPCGNCQPCRINNRRDKKTRLQLEAKNHDQNLWITLTYADKNLPTDLVRATDGRTFGSDLYPTLWRPDYQNFIKRLRNYGLPDTFKYFLVGEYGDQFERPHYHACLFGIGLDYQDRILRAWCREENQGTYDLIGHVYFGELNAHTMQYTAGYTVKKMTGFNHDSLKGRYPEFSASSKGLSLGAVEEVIAAMETLRLNDVPDYLVLSEQKVPVPRYIKNKVRERLGIETTEAKIKWEGEMLAMQSRQMEIKEGISIPALYAKEKRQSLLNQDAKLKLFFEKERLL